MFLYILYIHIHIICIYNMHNIYIYKRPIISHYLLGGGFKPCFCPETWGNDPIWRARLFALG